MKKQWNTLKVSSIGGLGSTTTSSTRLDEVRTVVCTSRLSLQEHKEQGHRQYDRPFEECLAGGMRARQHRRQSMAEVGT